MNKEMKLNTCISTNTGIGIRTGTVKQKRKNALFFQLLFLSTSFFVPTFVSSFQIITHGHTSSSHGNKRSLSHSFNSNVNINSNINHNININIRSRISTQKQQQRYTNFNHALSSTRDNNINGNANGDTNSKVNGNASTNGSTNGSTNNNINGNANTINELITNDLNEAAVVSSYASLAIQSKEIAKTAHETSAKHQSTAEQNLTSKAFNASLLIACFGFAIYSILSVDDGMTRGWSIAEKAMRIPLDNWSSYESSLNQQPIFTKTMINVVIYLLGDWLSQTLFIQKNLLEFDARRTLRNGFIGMCFGPLVHEYYEFSDSILPVEIGMNRFYKIFMDQTIYLSIKCSVYIVAVNVLAGESWEYSYESAKDKIKGIMFTAWKFWPLVHCVTYGAIPARHRILWVNCVDLFWNAILASMTSGSDDEEEDVENAEDGENSVENGNGIDAATAAAASINLVMETSMQMNGDDIDIAKVNESQPKLEKEDITELTEVLLESMKEGNNINGNDIGNGVENNILNTNGSNGLGNSKDASLEKEEKKDSDSKTVIIDDYSSEVTAATTAAAINGTSTSISGVL